MGLLESDGNSVNLSLIHCLLFGCIVSAVDPVAVLAIFQEVISLGKATDMLGQATGMSKHVKTGCMSKKTTEMTKANSGKSTSVTWASGMSNHSFPSRWE